ncbi:MAG TPA: energy-coupling factor transporter transmembrane component T [Methylomirabilota bacterium]|nr:energy-coupling factor transporter transmembrane component T [Methylomirabilota bacterium]
MNVAPRYLGRGSWLARRDPRVLILALAAYVLAAVQVWDLRLLTPMAVAALLYYRSAQIPWRAVRANWAYIAFFIGFIILVNTVLTGGELRGFKEADLHIYFRLPLLSTPISAEMVTYATVQLLRFGSMAAMGFPIAFAMAPGDIGPTFARLRVPYKFAYAIDLTFRFLPSLATDMQTTMDAQRIRGYEWDRVKGGPVGRLRKLGPLLVPVTINAIVGAEDTIDAMDLRGFGTGRRTWLRQLAYGRVDLLLLGAYVLLLLVITALSLTGHTRLWVPDVLIPRPG